MNIAMSALLLLTALATPAFAHPCDPTLIDCSYEDYDDGVIIDPGPDGFGDPEAGEESDTEDEKPNAPGYSCATAANPGDLMGLSIASMFLIALAIRFRGPRGGSQIG